MSPLWPWLAAISLASITAMTSAAGCPGAPRGYLYLSSEFTLRTSSVPCKNTTSYARAAQPILNSVAASCTQQASCNSITLRRLDDITWETCIFTSELRLTAYVLPTHIGVPATCEGTYIKVRGSVASWGVYNDSMIPIGAKSQLSQIAAGVSPAMALTTDGQVVVWGKGRADLEDVPSALSATRAIAIAAGDDTAYALSADGSPYIWGRALTYQPVPYPSGAIAVAAGQNLALLLLDNGSIRTWSDTQTEQVLVGLSGDAYVDIAAGMYHYLALTQSGRVYAWGSNTNNQATVPGYLQDGSVSAVAIAAGQWHSLALLDNGTVVAWGSNSDGQAAVPAGIQAISIAAFGWGSGAVTYDGTVVTWGEAQQPPTSQVKNAIELALGFNFGLALTMQGYPFNPATAPSPPTMTNTYPTKGSIPTTSPTPPVPNTASILPYPNINSPNNQAPNTTPSVPGASSNKVAIVGAVVGGLAGVAGLVGAVAYFSIRRKRRMQHGADKPYHDAELGKGPDTPDCMSDTHASPGDQHAGMGTKQGLDNAVMGDADTQHGDQHTDGAMSDSAAVADDNKIDSLSAGMAKVAAVGMGGAMTDTVASSSQIGVTHTGTEKYDTYVPSLAEDVVRGFTGAVEVHTVAERIMLHQTTVTPHGLASDVSISADGSQQASGVNVSQQSDPSAAAPAPVVISVPNQSGPSTANPAAVVISMSGEPSAPFVGPAVPTPVSEGDTGAVSQPVVDMATSEEDMIYERAMLARLRIAWESIQMGRVLGEGGFGTVYRGTWQGNAVAVKTLNKQHFTDAAQNALRKEALAMFTRPHPCIAHVYGLVDDGQYCALVMKYYRRGTLSTAINDISYCGLSLAQRLKIAQQVASGMSSLHDRNMLHGDLKTANLLIEDDGAGVMITDFGLSGVAGQAVASGAMTFTISPPEVLANPHAPRTQAGDVYAFAIVLLEILSGRPAYTTVTRDMLKRNVLAGRRPPIPASVPDDVSHIITQCWAQEPSERPTFTQVVALLTECVGRCTRKDVGGLDCSVTATEAVVGFGGVQGGRVQLPQGSMTRSYVPTS